MTFIHNNKHNQVTSTYYLLIKKKERKTGRNYVYEQVTSDKRNKGLIDREPVRVPDLSSTVRGKGRFGSDFNMNQTVRADFNKFGQKPSTTLKVALNSNVFQGKLSPRFNEVENNSRNA